MSRMFRVITGAGGLPTAPQRAAEKPQAIHLETPADDQTPFIEVGGPDGVQMSYARSQPRIAPMPLPSPIVERASMPKPATLPVLEPMVAAESDAQVLSVTFHRLPKLGLRLMPSGISPDIITYHQPDHAVSGEYRVVRDEIVNQFEEPGPRVTLFTSASGSAGTTTVMMNFAVSLTQEHGSRVLLVDANFARPGIARRLGASESPGLAEVLGQAIPLAWALQPTPLTNLHMLSTGTANDATEDLLTTDLPKLIGQLRQWFDWVIVDAGVWNELPGADATASATDAVYLVTRHSDIERMEFADLRADITNASGPVRGYISTR